MGIYGPQEDKAVIACMLVAHELSAWEAERSTRRMRPELRFEVSASDRETPLIPGVNGSLMARYAGPDLR